MMKRGLLLLSIQAAVALAEAGSPGSLYSPGGILSNIGRDMRAAEIGDVVTILVADKASAVSKGVTNTSRKSSLQYGITGAYGPVSTKLSNLLGANGATSLQGQGQTTRDSTLSTTVSVRVIDVMKNGSLLIEGSKKVAVNSENQTVTVRGIIRPSDVSPLNTVPSDRIADLNIRVDGKGVVNDSIKRPFILYRILMGLLPF
jgi:flagellar L-ring protein precursor FlgH